MAENILTAAPAQQGELADIQARIAQLIAGAQDDRSKRLVFQQIIMPLAELMPDVPLSDYPPKPAPISESERCLLEGNEKLRNASYFVEFVQSVTVNPSGGTLTLEGRPLTGFFLVMQNAIDLMREAETLIDKARKQPEALPA